MWSVTQEAGEYIVIDHNGNEQARITTDGGISTADVREVMHDRAAVLKDDVETAAETGQLLEAISVMTEWTRVVEDMASDEIELPSLEQR